MSKKKKAKLTVDEKALRAEISRKWFKGNWLGLMPLIVSWAACVMLILVMPDRWPDLVRMLTVSIPAFSGFFFYARFLREWEKAVDREFKRQIQGQEK